jgi:hypothetical protein
LRSQPRSRIALVALVVLALAVALPTAAVLARGRAATARTRAVAPASAATKRAAHRRNAKHRRIVSARRKALRAAAVKARAARVRRAAARRILAARALAAAKRKAASLRLVAYRGLASWVDIYDHKALAHPIATVHAMAARGVKTLFIETGNFHTPPAVNNAAALQVFIRECHAHHMRIVAWYLPNLKSGSVDFGRIKKAIAFKTASGQKFDGFALDIESSAVHSVAARNRGLLALTKRIRAYTGRVYPLGAIIPSPVGLAKKRGYWNVFPYATIAAYYDVCLPMGYYTYHGHGAKAALADTLGNVRIIRAQKGLAKKPIHLIGGISDNSSASQVRAFVTGVRRAKCYGASLYGWAGTTAADWKALRLVGK